MFTQEKTYSQYNAGTNTMAISKGTLVLNENKLKLIKDLILFLGGKPKTIMSFAGVGDLLMTSMSKKSRNYSFGYVIGSTKDPKKYEDAKIRLDFSLLGIEESFNI